jgi:hypothetical protein
VSITYPLNLPASPGFTRCRFGGHSVVAITRSPFTGGQQVQAYPGQWWTAELSLPPMKRAQAEAWNAFLLSLNGLEGTFLLGDPAARVPQGTATGTPLVDGASQTGNVLNTKGWTASQTGILRAGDYLQLGSGSSTHLHKVLADANSDGSQKAGLTIWPSLRTSPGNSDPITVLSPRGLFRLAGNDTAWDVDQLRLYGLTFSCFEAL